MKGRKPPIVQDAAALVTIPRAPAWLSKDGKAEWKRIMPLLVERKILTDADLAGLENYCVITARVREIERAIHRMVDLDPKLFRMQDQAIKTARQLAAELGLTPVSRSRASMRDDLDDDTLAFLG